MHTCAQSYGEFRGKASELYFPVVPFSCCQNSSKYIPIPRIGQPRQNHQTETHLSAIYQESSHVISFISLVSYQTGLASHSSYLVIASSVVTGFEAGNATDISYIAIIIYLDLRKAFDLVLHEELLWHLVMDHLSI